MKLVRNRKINAHKWFAISDLNVTKMLTYISRTCHAFGKVAWLNMELYLREGFDLAKIGIIDD